eukprot:2007345-Amphidinium_carterae.1
MSSNSWVPGGVPTASSLIKICGGLKRQLHFDCAGQRHAGCGSHRLAIYRRAEGVPTGVPIKKFV